MPRINAEYHRDAKRKIITATLDIARESGWNTVTLEAVARRVGVTKAALYTYFENSSSLNEEATFELIRKFQESILADSSKEEVGIDEAIERIARRIFTDIDPIAPLFMQAFSRILKDARFREQVSRIYDKISHDLCKRLRKRQKSGQIPAQVDIPAALQAINGLTLGLVFIYKMSEIDPLEPRTIWIESVERMLMTHDAGDAR